MSRLKRFLGLVALLVATLAAQCEGETACPAELDWAIQECLDAGGTPVVDYDEETGVWTIRCEGV